MNLKRRDHSYRRPSRWRVHFVDPLGRFMIRRGVAPGRDSQDGSGMRVLEVRGRKTGRWYERPVAVLAVNGYFKVDPKPVTLAQARELAMRYPVFRIKIAARPLV